MGKHALDLEQRQVLALNVVAGAKVDDEIERLIMEWQGTDIAAIEFCRDPLRTESRSPEGQQPSIDVQAYQTPRTECSSEDRESNRTPAAHLEDPPAAREGKEMD